MDEPKRVIDSDPGQEREPAILLVGLDCPVGIRVDIHLVVVVFAIDGRRGILRSVEESDQPLGGGEVGELWLSRLVVRDRVGDPLDGLVADPIGAEVHAVGGQPSLALVRSARHGKPGQGNSERSLW